MPDLKPISSDAVSSALEKAGRYRLLNEPLEAESICRDILIIDDKNQQALVTLVLALTDQFGKNSGVEIDQAQEVLGRLSGEYDREYYAGVILERWGKNLPTRGMPRYVVHDWLRQAMAHYESAEAIRPTGNDESILRWNTCARILQREANEDRPDSGGDEFSSDLDDEVPTR